MQLNKKDAHIAAIIFFILAIPLREALWIWWYDLTYPSCLPEESTKPDIFYFLSGTKLRNEIGENFVAHIRGTFSMWEDI